jgi:two-component system sensor histidine kinase UhpB
MKIIKRGKIEGVSVDHSDNIYKAIFENSIDAILITSVDGGIQAANQAACKLFGRTEADIIKSGRKGVLDLNDERLTGMLEERTKTGKVSGSLNYKRGDGSVFPADFTSTVFKDTEGKDRTITIIRDISKLKDAEEAIRKSEEKYKLLSEQSGVGVALYSPAGKILYFNQQALKNLGGKSEDFTGKSLIEVFGRKAGTKYLKRVSEEIRLEKNIIYEDYLESASGIHWFSSTHSVIRDLNGEVIGVQVVSIDISERKLIESQLNQSANELRELTRHLVEVKEAERTRIARDLHDDLGQKLTALNMDVSWLKSRIGVQSRTVENKFEQMISLLNNTIESVQKISHGLRPSILDDLGLLPAIEWQVTEFHRTSGISCNITYSPNEIEVDSRISLVVFRIVQEALTNIARHSGASKVAIKVALIEGVLDVSIKDNGCGIEQTKINNSKSFGLLGMRERAGAVEGEVVISGRRGEGTRVRVRIAVGK